MSHDVFISYSQGDKTAADAACAVLEQRGIRCWIAPRDVRPGATWPEAIIDATSSARVMVLVFSSHANESEHVRREVGRAVEKGIPIIPVRLEDVVPEKSLEYFLSETHWLNAFPPPLENYLNNLADAVLGYLEGSSRKTETGAAGAAKTRPLLWPWIAAVCAAAVAIGGYIVWPRTDPNAFEIGPISVPQKFADATGMTGDVIAQHLLAAVEKLEAVSSTYAMRTPRSCAVADANASFVTRLFDRRGTVSGDVTQSAGSWELSLRSPDGAGNAVPIGKDADAAVGAQAHWLFSVVEPYRYAVVLGEENRHGAALDFLRMAQSPQSPDYLWAVAKLSENRFAYGHVAEACSAAEDANRIDPKFIPVMLDLANCRFALGNLRDAQSLMEEGMRRISGRLPPDINPKSIEDFRPQLRSRLLEFEGDWAGAVEARLPVRNSTINHLDRKIPEWDAADLARAHDVDGATARLREAGVDLSPEGAAKNDGYSMQQFQTVGFAPANFFIAVALDDWAGAADDLSAADNIAAAFKNNDEMRKRWLWPWLSYAEMRAGRAKEADAAIADVPRDCYVCLEMRGRVAAARGDLADASHWFDAAVSAAPALPFAYDDWGEALLAHGDANGAIAKFAAAHGKGARFADPIEHWGEALMHADRSDLALAKFADAAALAPDWGHLDLAWAEALFYAGRKGDAKLELSRAAQLPLSASDTRELAILRAKIGD